MVSNYFRNSMNDQPYQKFNPIGLYFSILSMILICFLVFIPLSIGIQQVLIALTALFILVFVQRF